jgi:hypothetical protein
MISDPDILICLYLLGEVPKQFLSSFLILSGAYGNCFDISPQGHMGSSNLCKLSCREVEVGSCSICYVLLGLSDCEVQVWFDLVIIILYLHKDVVCFCFITLDLAAETVDFNCGMMQLVYNGVSPFGNRVEFDGFYRWDIIWFAIICAN